MIVDVFLFHDEFDMLRCRGYELDGVVDMHVAIEGNRTMSGRPREYRLTGDEIPGLEVVYVDLTDVSDVTLPYDIDRAVVRPTYSPPDGKYPYADHWKRDWKQRDGASGLIASLPSDTVVMYGDVDEIPGRDFVAAFDQPTVSTVRMESLIYSTKWTGGPVWSGPVIGRRDAHLGGFARMRALRGSLPHLDGGWHLSWFGGREAVIQKVLDFAHGEMAEDLDRVISDYEHHIWPGGTVELFPYSGDLPRYVQDGLAPSTWEDG